MKFYAETSRKSGSLFSYRWHQTTDQSTCRLVRIYVRMSGRIRDLRMRSSCNAVGIRYMEVRKAELLTPLCQKVQI